MNKRVLHILLFSLLSAVLVGFATMYSRSETLRSVRNVDAKLISHLVSATVTSSKGEDFVRELQTAFEVLGGPRSSGLKMGLALYRGTDLVATNMAEKLPGLIVDHASHDAMADYEDIALGDGWKLIIYRPEQKYSYGEYFSFLQTPTEQLLNEADNDVTWSAVKRKAGRPILITFFLILVIGVLMELFLQRNERELERIQARLQKSDRHLATMLDEKSQLVEARDSLQTELRNLERGKRQDDDLSKLAYSEIRSLEERIKQYDDKIEEKNDYIARVEKENGDLSKKVGELEKEQGGSDKREATIAEKQLEIIKKIWPKHEWHPKALEEARDWYLGANDKNRKERLTQLLTNCTSPHETWSQMKYIDNKLLHNGGKERVKLYWEKMKNDLPRVIKVCSGDDIHLGTGSNAQLAERLNTVRRQG